MNIKQFVKMFNHCEWVRIWGEDDEIPLWGGPIGDIPCRLADKELIKGPDGVYIDIRYNCGDIDHIAIFVEGE